MSQLLLRISQIILVIAYLVDTFEAIMANTQAAACLEGSTEVPHTLTYEGRQNISSPIATWTLCGLLLSDHALLPRCGSKACFGPGLHRRGNLLSVY